MQTSDLSTEGNTYCPTLEELEEEWYRQVNMDNDEKEKSKLDICAGA